MQMRKALDSSDISELIDEIRSLVVGSWRLRWQAISLAWVICVASWLFIFNIPDVYTASTRLHIDTTGSLRPLLRGLAIDTNLLDDVRVMVNSIASRPNLEKIAVPTGLDVGVQGPAEMDDLLDRMADNITIGFGRNHILEMSFVEANPRIAQSVVANLADMFIESLLRSNRSDTESAQEFIEGKVIEYEELLADAEMRLAEFKKRNVGQMPGEQGGYYQRLQSEINKLGRLESELKRATQMRDSLQSQMAGEAPVFGLMASDRQNVMINSPQIFGLEAQLTDLRLQYTDSHPDVVRIQALLETLRADLAQQSSGNISPDFTPLDENPVYQQMRIQFNQVNLEVSSLNAKWKDQIILVDRLRDKVDTLPEIEAELTRLNRRYNVNRAQYDALLNRLETARLSEDADESTTSIKFRVIEPPTVPSSPTGPNRLLLMTLVLVVGMAAGLALAMFWSFLVPVFYSSRVLERRYGVPVLGAIEWRPSSVEQAQFRMTVGVFSFCVFGLIISYVVVVFLGQSDVLFAVPSGTMIG